MTPFKNEVELKQHYKETHPEIPADDPFYEKCMSVKKSKTFQENNRNMSVIFVKSSFPQ